MADKKKTITVQFKAEFEQFKSALSDVKGSTTSTIDALVSARDAGSKLWATLAHGFGVVQAGVGFVKSAIGAWQEYAESMKRSRIEADNTHAAMLTVGKEAFSKIREAAQGYISDSELLRASSKAMSGELGITSSQMSSLTEAAIKLSRDGYGPTNEILDRLVKSVRTGGTDALKDFGIVIAEGGTAADKSKRILKELENQASQLGNTSRTLAQEYERDEIKKTKALEEFRKAQEISFASFGERAEALIIQHEREELALKKSKAAWDEWGKSVEEAGGIAKWSSQWIANINEQIAINEIGAKNGAKRVKDLMEEMTRKHKEMADEINTHAQMRREEDLARQEQEYKKKLDAQKKYQEEQKKLAEDRLREEQDQNAAIDEALRDDTEQRKKDAEEFIKAIAEKLKIPAKLKKEMLDQVAALEGRSKGRDSMSEYFDRVREKARDWETVLRDIGSDALPAFAQAAGNAMMLLTSGQAGAAESFKNMLHSFAEQESTKLWGLGLESTVLALKDSFWNPAAAASEAAAAAMAFAGAAAMSIVAGVTAPSEPTAASGASSAGAGSATKEGVGYQPSNQSVQQNVTIQIGYGYLGDRKSLSRELQGILDEASIKGWTGRTTVRRSA